MKHLAGSKLLCALLAVVAVGMGVQTYYLFKVHRQLGAPELRAAQATAAQETQLEDEQAALPAGPQKALLPADPFAQLDRTEERLRSLFDDFHDRFDRNFGRAWFDPSPLFDDGDSFFSGRAGLAGPRIDLQDRGDSYEMTVDVPGSDETEVVVRVEDEMLIVEGSRATTTEESEPGSFVRRERQFGRFERRLALPQDADGSTLRTEFENGVLKATLQKRA